MTELTLLQEKVLGIIRGRGKGRPITGAAVDAARENSPPRPGAAPRLAPVGLCMSGMPPM